MRFSRTYVKKRFPINKLEKYTIRILLIFLGVLFISSMIIGQVENRKHLPPSHEDILNYASTYLPGGEMEPSGVRFDCSGFTRNVYSKFNVHLPPSSTGQYEITSHVGIDSVSPGDLIFFNTSGNGISHVAIYLDSSKFIHSPGIGRAVKIDSLGQTYWKTRIICGGKINYNL